MCLDCSDEEEEGQEGAAGERGVRCGRKEQVDEWRCGARSEQGERGGEGRGEKEME